MSSFELPALRKEDYATESKRKTSGRESRKETRLTFEQLSAHLGGPSLSVEEREAVYYYEFLGKTYTAIGEDKTTALDNTGETTRVVRSGRDKILEQARRMSARADNIDKLVAIHAAKHPNLPPSKKPAGMKMSEWAEHADNPRRNLKLYEPGFVPFDHPSRRFEGTAGINVTEEGGRFDGRPQKDFPLPVEELRAMLEESSIKSSEDLDKHLTESKKALKTRNLTPAQLAERERLLAESAELDAELQAVRSARTAWRRRKAEKEARQEQAKAKAEAAVATNSADGTMEEDAKVAAPNAGTTGNPDEPANA